MSSILEALKKVEDEKAARQSGAGHIAGKVVKSRRRAKKESRWFLPVAMAVVAIVAVLATYLFMAGRTATVETVRGRPAAQSDQGEIEPRKPSPPRTAPAPIPPPPKAAPRKETARQTTAPAKPTRAPAAASAPRTRVETAPAEIPAPLPQADAKPPLPSLKVTGIGWQKDNADRLAIVNGRPVTEGAVIEGARVEEIFPDRVRFSMGDRTIEVPLGRFPEENP